MGLVGRSVAQPVSISAGALFEIFSDICYKVIISRFQDDFDQT